jgi:hypothetical protein
MRPTSDDSLFQLSLTELAFILVFVVLLLIGAKLVLDRGEADKSQEMLTACVQEKNDCVEALAKGGGDPNVIIDTLVNAPKLRKELEESRAREQELQEKLKAFAALREKFPDPARVKAAEDFLDAYEKGTKTPLSPDAAKKQGEDAARLARELDNCRGQLKHCVRVTGAPKGYGLPPCWLDSAGQIQYLLNVEIRPDGLAVERAWLPERDDDANQLPGLRTTLEAGVQSLDQFKSNTQAILGLSKRANPECRHYVVIRRAPSLRDIDQFNRLRLGVEDHFYKLDKTGPVSR